MVTNFFFISSIEETKQNSVSSMEETKQIFVSSMEEMKICFVFSVEDRKKKVRYHGGGNGKKKSVKETKQIFPACYVLTTGVVVDFFSENITKLMFFPVFCGGGGGVGLIVVLMLPLSWWWSPLWWWFRWWCLLWWLG